jgi:ABC-type uncharacterized transport system permease subunit
MNAMQSYENALLTGAAGLYLAAMLLLWGQLFFHADDISERMEKWHAASGAWGHRLLLGGVLLHLLSLVGQGAPLFSARVGVVGLFGWILAVAYLLVGPRMGRTSMGAFVVPLVLVATLYSVSDPALHRTSRPENLELPWLIVHVAAILLSYSALAIAFAASVIYFLQERLLKRKRLAGLWQRLPSLQVADEWIYRATLFGISWLTLGILTGVAWKQLHQTTYDIFGDPKVQLTIVTWLTFAMYLGARWWLGWRGRRTNMVVVYGFLLLVISFFGAPHVLSREAANDVKMPVGSPTIIANT